MRFLICAVAVLCFAGCKKTVEKTQQDLLIKLITTGQWSVTSYVKGPNDITPDFSAYKFQFKEDRTVDAIKSNAVEKTGSWDGSMETKTIVSNFTNANTTLTLLNGNWYITDSGLTYVISTQTVNGELRKLRLDKQ